MAICTLNKNLLRSNTCGYSLPEVTDIYVANFDDVTEAPVDYNCESGVTISTFSAKTEAKVFHIEPAKNSTTYTD